MVLDGLQRIEPNQAVSTEKLQVTAVFERGLILLALPSPTTIFFANIPAVRKGCFFCLWGMPVAQQTARSEAPRMRSIWFDTGGARERRERYPSPTTIFFALTKAKKMKPEKASLHTAVKRCFIIRRIASYGKAVLHKTPFQMKHCSTVVSQYEAFAFANMKHSAYAPYDE